MLLLARDALRRCAHLHSRLDAVLFEPGNHLPAKSSELEPQDVPTSSPELLGTRYHLLLNELMRSPKTLLAGVLKLAHQATDLDTGTLKVNRCRTFPVLTLVANSVSAPVASLASQCVRQASTTTVILYVIRLAARIENYLSFLLQVAIA